MHQCPIRRAPQGQRNNRLDGPDRYLLANALAESFFGALKNELIYRTLYPTREKARRAIAEHIEVF